MSESKHTPGPWELVSLSGYGSPFSIRMAYNSDNPGATKTHYGVQSVRRREDARLIAAAPDMLEALKRLRAASTSIRDDIESETVAALAEADAAIAKAEGADA